MDIYYEHFGPFRGQPGNKSINIDNIIDKIKSFPITNNNSNLLSIIEKLAIENSSILGTFDLMSDPLPTIHPHIKFYYTGYSLKNQYNKFYLYVSIYLE